jgi:hypothetical protein
MSDYFEQQMLELMELLIGEVASMAEAYKEMAELMHKRI